MPIYKVGCDTCGDTRDIFRSLKEYDDLPMCCGASMHRRVCAPAVIADIQPYRSMATGEFIEGRRQHRDHLKRHGLIEIGNEKVDNQPRPEAPDLKGDIAQAAHQVLG
jgi:hypothetical protein